MTNTQFVTWLICGILWDIFCIGGSVWLVIVKYWSGWTIVGGIVLAGCYISADRIVMVLKEKK